MARRKVVAGNWKMNGLNADLSEIAAIATAAAAHGQVDAALCVPFTLIAAASGAVPGFAIGAQDCHARDSGAHTGCISAPMLVEAGARLTIVGHSERRADQHETSAQVRDKARAAHAHGLDVILCVGETEAERDAGHAEQVVRKQIEQSMPDDADAEWLSLAYEPCWAIGTGRTPTLEEIAAIHGVARATLRAMLGEEGDRVCVLYGGSVNGDNAAAILSTADVDGALVGGASLTAAKFVPIIEAAARC